MQIGLLGLGKMGANMARRLARGGANVLVWNRSHEVAEQLAQAEANISAYDSLSSMVAQMASPRIIWLMLPAGDATEMALQQLAGLLAPGDIVVDGANAFYKDSQRHAVELKEYGLRFMDAGVSGGIWGLANGYALMIGGEADTVAHVIPFIRMLAPGPDTGWLHCGPVGSGHFVKMVHNGIEYGMMQALAEGLSLLKGKQEFGIDLAAVSEMWRHGSVVRSWLLDLTAEFLQTDQTLEGIAPFVADSGEGRWTVLESVEQGTPAPVMTLALMMRFASQGKHEYTDKLLAMMRKGFGGHGVKEGV
ncbi:6-phosphogluconate dehydrogenase (decarboxylating) [Sulfuriferula sp. AH1]|uniref:phosphogluconate dehydrogenase (NAD(+)-dependent, decarboxylating) n=1 Tax=Sulfuriferula sp. AH1 TaxID=1985873 RepID=UPI000B3B7F84|nr:decarboxylating 6-phosphogluconate dehydrogenase [Sulfuriferula sp. AH1]ARU30812.1 6-phosphogluconate dehydrogenase (decarboxylating) [Sulfuriferula sp. AH1]